MQQIYSAPVSRRSSYGFRLPTSILAWTMLGGTIALSLSIVALVAISLGVMVIYASGRILPGVTAGGVSVSGLSLEEATTQLQANWTQIKLQDGNRSWLVNPALFGLSLDPNATALAAQNYGRGDGSIITALIGNARVSPSLNVNSAILEKSLNDFAATVNLPPANATIHMVNGALTAIPAVEGRQIDIRATVDHLVKSADEDLANGGLNLVMIVTQPAITDATPLLQRAQQLLTSPLTINAFDPIANQRIIWSVAPDQWGQWLSTQNTSTGISFSVDHDPLSNYLNGQGKALSGQRYLNIDESIQTIQSAVAAEHTYATIRIYNPPTKYQVGAGETLEAIAWKEGIPFWQIQQANPGVDLDNLSVGQTITIPSKDVMVPLPIIDNKRIVASISKQHMTVYENGQVKWDWVASTGIPTSPTMPGVFQVQSHELDAYAGLWNLYMPNFMGIYDAVPGFTNGIHGFPSRNGVGILWEGSLGHPVTFGCILISSQNAQLLYNWAENGVVVEVQP